MQDSENNNKGFDDMDKGDDDEENHQISPE